MVSLQTWGTLPTSLPLTLPQGFQIKSLTPMNTPKEQHCLFPGYEEICSATAESGFSCSCQPDWLHVKGDVFCI